MRTSLILGLLILVCAHTFARAEVFNDSYIQNIDNHAIAFLRIELETCGYVRWCTINVTREIPYPTPCCQGCACDPRCEQTGSCCPDYEFANQTNWPIYTAVSDFDDAFVHWTVNANANEDRNNKIGNMLSNTTPSRQCLRSQVKSSSKFRESTGSFDMINKCTLGDDADIMMKARCTLDYQEKIETGEPDEYTSFENLVPVTSLKDGKIYKNIHCFACSSKANDSSSPWEVSALCSVEQLSNLYYVHFANPNSFLEAIASNSNYLSTCNIIFEPDHNNTKTLQDHMCSEFDFDRCPHSNITAQESELCMRYASPVYEYSGPGSTRVTYKNSACKQCQSNNTDLNNICYANHDIRRLKIGLNVPREMAGMGVTEHGNDLLYVRFPGDTDHGCKAGEVFDRRADVCRKMYCPKGMFAFRGECRNFFRHVEDGLFSVLLRLVHTSSINSNTDVVSAIYNKAILMAKNNLMIQIKGVVIWQSSQSKFILTLTFTVDHVEGTFSDAIRFTDHLVKDTWFIKANTLNVPFNASLAYSAKQSSRIIVDLQNGDKYSVAYPKSQIHVAKMSNYSRLDITEENFCYRVSLGKDEYTLVPYNEAIKIKSSGKSIFKYTQIFNDPQRNELVCAEHVLERSSEIKKAPIFKKDDVANIGVNGPKMVDESEGVDENVIETSVGPLLLALTVVLALGTCIARGRLAQRVLHRDTTQ